MMASLGQGLCAVGRFAADQLAKQTIGQIVEIAHALAQIRVGDRAQPRAHVALHLLDAGLGGQAVADRLLHALHPALVVGEHAIGFQHVAVFALECHIAARQHVVDGQSQAGERGRQPLQFGLGVIVEHGRDDDARFMQDDMSQPDAFGQGLAVMCDRLGEIEFDAG